ncbi:MAG: hypothetical protein ABJD07_05685, partial [Gemmatimonadaceae bacterium]
LTVRTTDVWTTRPRLNVRASGNNSVGFEERNFLGTGRSISLSVASDLGVLAAVAQVSDPFFLGRDIAANLRYASYGDGRSLRGLLQNRERSVYDSWRNTIFFSTSRRAADLDTSVYTLNRDAGTVLVGPRIAADPRRVWYALAGIEYENTALHVDNAASLVGPEDVDRRFRGIDLGLGRRTARYAAIDWLVPRKTLVDVPLGFEQETVLGLGREEVVGEAMLHGDSWFGRMFLPSPTALVVADGWLSGYFTAHDLLNGSMRGSLATFVAAPGGQWMARVAGERLFEPDPDVRALATIDPLVRFISPSTRLAETGFTASVERSWHVWDRLSSFAIDGALFTTYSRREGNFGPDADAESAVFAAVVGVGIRIVPTTSGVGPGRVDLVYPLARSSTLPRRLFLSLNVAPWLGGNRHRDAYRER